MITELRHYTNNGYDTIVALSGSEVVGAWVGDGEAVRQFYATVGGDVSDWHENSDDWRPSDEHDKLVATIGTDGALASENESLLSQRKNFWGIV